MALSLQAVDALDRKIFLSLNSLAGRSKVLDDVWRGAAYLMPYVFLLLCLPMMHTWLRFFEFATAVVIAQGTTRTIRLFWHRRRPFYDEGLHAKKLLHKGDEAAFPSAHAASLFAIAMVAVRINPVVGAVLLVLAILNAFARVVTSMHYPSDVLAGALLGIAIGAAFIPVL